MYQRKIYARQVMMMDAGPLKQILSEAPGEDSRHHVYAARHRPHLPSMRETRALPQQWPHFRGRLKEGLQTLSEYQP